MYKVSIFNDEIETVIHSPHVNGHKLESGVVKKEINKIDSFDMSFYLNNPAHGKLKPFKTLIKVLNTKNNKYEFEGRILNPNGRMEDDGLITYSYTAEGELAYLHDSQQRHLEYRGTPKDLFETLLDYHNEQVEDFKKFYPGEMEVTTSTDNIYIYLSAEKTTFEEIEDKILDRVGGELRIRKEDDKRYLDVLERVGADKQTEIRVAKNLKTISQNVDPTEIITRLTPLGERIESEDEDATDASEARLTIEDVNGGIPYIDRQDLIDEFGIIGGHKTWDDITLPSRLLSTAQNWMDNQKVVLYQYELTAVDLSLIGLDIDGFDVGNSHPVINPIMGIDDRLRIVGKSIDINNPHDDSLTIGDKFKNLDEYQLDAIKSEKKVVELEGVVESQSKRIVAIRQELQNVDSVLEDLNNAIGDADIPALENAIDNLNQAVSNLADAVDNIPDYDPATETVDGLMSASDKQKINRITVSQNINLDQLLQRVIDLEEEVFD